ncbi:MAG: NfeD family protein [Tannerella sp.]|jgi:membrane-bound ClpP family serine protease|nr:NfeD family protein [Tannerella sp.]
MAIDIIIIVFLMTAAIFLIIAEIFLLPGITIAGIAGALFAIGGVAYAYSISVTTGNITLGGSILSFGGLFLWLLRSNSFNRVSLKTDIESTVISPRDMELKVGDEGTTLSRLAPIGKARFNNITVEAKSINGFIDENTPVIIIRIDGYNVVVENKNNINNT